MRSRIVAVAIPAVIVLGALVLAGCTAHPTDAYSKIAHLDQGTVLASGETPPIVPGTDSELVRSSLRLLAVHDETEFWVGVTRDDDVCFIAESTLTGEQTEASCVDAERFGRYGATLQLESPEQRVWLHTEYMTVGTNWTEISANIAVRS
ncbi:hypothetical protein ACEXQE_08905 [Herbiconiux sp. P17]|uniref:hypothetical protein n=1 Tax=Herbiconiux wuyangfengii TaxID=3342794 RepID=UPI0035B92F04